MREQEDKAWHLDKKVPIALIATIVLAFGTQTITGVWWASNQSARLEQAERELAQLKPQASTTVEKVIRIETKVESIVEGLTELKNEIRAVIRQRSP